MRFTRLLLQCAALLAAACAPFLPAQTFFQPKVIPTGNWPAAVYSADINNDGYPDLIYIDQGATPGQPSTTHILLNDGHGNFAQSAVIATVGNSLAIGDFLATGKVSLAWIVNTGCPAGRSNYLCSLPEIAPGNGDGTFGTTLQTTSVNPYGPTGSFAAPIYAYLQAVKNPGQARADIAAEDLLHGNLLIFHILNASLTVSYNGHPITYLNGATGILQPGQLTVTDINGDGYPDLTLMDTTDQVAITLQNVPASGGYRDFFPFTGQPIAGLSSLLIQDVNLDGRPDLIAEGLNGHIDVYPGNGDGTFQTTSIGGTGTLNGLTGNGGHLIATGDFNHDGQIDALTATPAGISVLLGQRTQYLGLKGIYNTGPGGFGGPPGASAPTDYALADFNHDGNLDLALDSPEGIAILYGNADGSFQTSQAYAAGQPAMSGALAKFTSSGHLDAVVSTGATQAQLLLGNGAGTFAATSSPTSSQNGPVGLWSVVQAADFKINSPSVLDLLLTADGPAGSFPQNSKGIQLQLGNGTGTFSAPIQTSGNTSTCSTYPGARYGTSAIGSDLSSSIIVNRDFSGFTVIYGADPNGDSDLGDNSTADVSAPCSSYAHDLAVTGIFTPRSPTVIPAPESDIFVQADGHLLLYKAPPGVSVMPAGDLSVDGSLTTAGQAVAPALNSVFNGAAIPVSSGGLGFPAFIGSMATADLDRDGNTDLLAVYANLSANLSQPTASAPNYLYVWFGNGNGKFPISAAHPTNPVRIALSRNYYQVAIADMNGDGIPDLILSDGYILSIQLGKGDGTFGAETHYLAGQGINTISVGDLRGTGHNDLVLANGGAVLSNPVANLEKLATNPDVNTGGVTVLLNQVSSLLAPAITLTVTPEPSNYSNGFSVMATIAGVSGSPTPTGTVTFSIDGSLGVITGNVSFAGTVAVAYGAPNTIPAGSHIITAAYSGDSFYQATTVNVSHVIAPAVVTPTGTLIASPEPSTYGNPWSITATINTTPGSATPTGTVSFFVDGTSIASTPFPVGANGTAVIPEPNLTLAAGTHTLTAVYSGDANYATITLTGTHVIAAASPGYTVTATPEPSVYGNPFTLTATAAGPGSFDFSVDSTDIGTVTSTTSTASITAPGTFSVGNHALTVVWHASLSALTAGISGTHQITISPTTLSLVLCVDAPGSLFPCATPIGSTPLINPVTMFYGQSLDGVATESASNLTGSLIFYDGAGIFCTLSANLVGGGNVCPTQSGYFNAGSRIVYAMYTGDANNSPSTSNSIAVNVFPDPTTATLTSSLNPATVGTPLTFTAILAGNFSTPNGTVSFYDGTTLLGGASLDPTGHANFTTSTLAVGSHPISVKYAGNSNFNAVASLTLTQVITAVVVPPPPGAGFALAINPDPVTVGAGATAALRVVITAQSASTPPIALSCSGLPAETTCNFVTPIIPAGGGITTLQLHITAPHDCGSTTPYFIGQNISQPTSQPGGPPPAAPYAFATLFLGSLALFKRRRTALRGLAVIAFAFAAFASLSGCSGHCTDLGVRPGSYTFTVTATPQGTTASPAQSLTIPLTVTIP